MQLGGRGGGRGVVRRGRGIQMMKRKMIGGCARQPNPSREGGLSYRLTFCCARDCLVSLRLLPCVLLCAHTLAGASAHLFCAHTHTLCLSRRIELISLRQLTSEGRARCDSVSQFTAMAAESPRAEVPHRALRILNSLGN